MTGFTNTPGWVAQTQNDTKSTHLSDNNQAEPQGKPQGMSDTVKKRGFMRYPAKYLGKRIDVRDSEGQVVARLYPPSYEESNTDLPKNFEANFLDMYNKIESLDAWKNNFNT